MYVSNKKIYVLNGLLAPNTCFLTFMNEGSTEHSNESSTAHMNSEDTLMHKITQRCTVDSGVKDCSSDTCRNTTAVEGCLYNVNQCPSRVSGRKKNGNSAASVLMIATLQKAVKIAYLEKTQI